MMNKTPAVLCVILVSLTAAVALADVRPLSTDRPDRTEGAYSVPRGWVQVESDLVSWGRFEENSDRVTLTSLFTINAKYGLLDNTDLQFLFSPWVRSELEHSGVSAGSESGTGPAGLRVKVNLVGNDGGSRALALLPFALVPTRGDAVFDRVTWGVLVPVAFSITDRIGLGATAGFNRIENEDTWGVVSASLGSTLTGNLSGFVELFHSNNGFDSDAVDDTTLDFGVTYAPRPDWLLDFGVYRGLNSTSEDWRVFAGASTRLPVR